MLGAEKWRLTSPDLPLHLTQNNESQEGADCCLFKEKLLHKRLTAADSNDVALRLASEVVDLKVVLNFAEITDRKHIKNLKVLFIGIVDLVLGVTRNEQHSSWFDRMHHTLNRDCPTS